MSNLPYLILRRTHTKGNASQIDDTWQVVAQVYATSPSQAWTAAAISQPGTYRVVPDGNPTVIR